MEITKAGVAIVAAACVTVGAAGGYLLTRPTQPSAATEPATGVVSPDPDGLAVEQSEALVTDEAPVSPPASAPAPKPAARPAPASRPPALKPTQVAAATPPAPVAPQPQTLPIVAAPAPVLTELPRPVEIEAPIIPEPPPGPELEDLVLAGDSVIGLQVETAVSSETARVEDPVVARVVRDIKVGDQVAIPAGSKARGEVTLVERGGRMRERARLGVRFTSIVLADGRDTEVPISTETIYREGDAPGRESTAKIGGGAIGGAILGGILGGAKGAAIGGAIGGGAGSAAVLAGGRNPATLSPGSPVTIRLEQPATITVEK